MALNNYKKNNYLDLLSDGCGGGVGIILGFSTEFGIEVIGLSDRINTSFMSFIVPNNIRVVFPFKDNYNPLLTKSRCSRELGIILFIL